MMKANYTHLDGMFSSFQILVVGCLRLDSTDHIPDQSVHLSKSENVLQNF